MQDGVEARTVAALGLLALAIRIRGRGWRGSVVCYGRVVRLSLDGLRDAWALVWLEEEGGLGRLDGDGFGHGLCGMVPSGSVFVGSVDGAGSGAGGGAAVGCYLNVYGREVETS